MKKAFSKKFLVVSVALCGVGFVLALYNIHGLSASTDAAAFASRDQACCQELARVLAEPLYEIDSSIGGNITYENEYSRVRDLLVALDKQPSDPALRAIWTAIQPSALECSALLDRIGEVDKTKPSNFQTLLSFIDLAVHASHDDKDDTTLEKMSNLKGTWDSSKAMRDRIGAEIDLDQLRGQYRVASCTLRNAAEALFTEGAGSVARDAAPAVGMIGLGLKLEEGKVVVGSVYSGSPAALAGIKAGEVIETINGRSTQGGTLDTVLQHLCGVAGTTAELGISSKGESARIVTLRRAESIANCSPFVGNYVTSLNGTYDADTLSLTNSTPGTLHHCLILVRASDGHFYSPHLHYIDEWKTGSIVKTAYRIGDDGLGFDNTCDGIRHLSVQIVSEELKHGFEKTYTDAELDSFAKDTCDKLKFRAAHLPYDPGFFWNDDRGAQFDFTGLSRIHPGVVKLTLVEGGSLGQKQSVSWEGSAWEGGDSRDFRDARFNNMHPSGIILELQFPHVTYKARYSWGEAGADTAN